MPNNKKEHMIQTKETKKSFWSVFTDPVILLFTIIAFASLLTYLIPAGAYDFKYGGW